jgi:chitinase
MMKTIRSVFNTSGRKLGLTFTAPSSYWYLRWFDLPGLIKYVDWINVYVTVLLLYLCGYIS